MDFKTFAKGKGKADSNNTKSKVNSSNNKNNATSKKDSNKASQADNSDDMKKFVEDAVNSRKHKSQDELLSEIIETATKQRKDGTLNDADLDSFFNSVSPMLNGEQLSKLQNIMKMLK